MEITIFDVDSGDHLPLSLPVNATIADLKNLAEEYISVPVKRMILLKSDPPYLRIDSNQTLKHGFEIFLFNKASFSKSRTASLREEPMFRIPDRLPIQVPPMRSVPPSSPMVRAVYEYERVVLENAARAASMLQ